MHLGVSYNVFDGEELLESSIQSIRDQCEYINVVFQRTSNFGNPCSADLEDILYDMVGRKLIDEIILYEPNLRWRPIKNETKKRNIGLKQAKKRNCSHFLSMDCDEYYDRRQFSAAKDNIEQGGIDISACRFINYVKSPRYRVEGHPEYFVPFISKLGLFTRISRKFKFPVRVDPSRRVVGSRFLVFAPDELVMHHMSFVRRDLAKKFANSSARDLYEERGVEEFLKDLAPPGPWIDPTANIVDPDAKIAFEIVEVENQFNVPEFY